MTDVRAMLRAERAARAPAPKSRKAVPAAPPPSKKRKADAEEDEADTRKRSRPEISNENLPAGFFDAREGSEEVEDEEPKAPIDGFVPAEDEESIPLPKTEVQQPKQPAREQAEEAPVNEDEWAAFQAFTSSVASLPKSNASSANAIALESAPQTSAQIAAEDEAAKEQRSRREEEIADEKEDAAERLEEEFEVMGELEGRIARLKEKRENLRRASRTSQDAPKPVLAGREVTQVEAVQEEEESSDEEDVDEFAGWRFGSR